MATRKQVRVKNEAALLQDPNTWDHFFKIISAGEPTKSAAAYLEIPINKLLSYLKGHDDLSQRYEDAMRLRADYHGERIEKIANDVEVGDMDAAAARVSLDARKFLASRYNPDRWGDKQRVDLNVTDINALHLEAIRALGLSENVIEHEGPPLVES
tara:strand:+ start:337 stop:804 length:468 start_codon:yes stop_codon:yes gene_type:complete